MCPATDATLLTQELVRIASESSDPLSEYEQGPEARIVSHLASLCDQAGIRYELQEALPGRENLIAHFPQANQKKLLLIAHMDTVSARGMHDPFSGSRHDNKIWGRGACDDKGPLAAAFSTLLHLHRNKTQLAYAVTFAATVDEECTLSGAAALTRRSEPFDLCICLEPTRLQLIKAHKGVYRCRITAHGHAAHSSSPENGRNAILIMHDIMKDLFLLDFRIRRKNDAELGRPSLAITQIQGGTSINIIPDLCTISIDVRLLPDQDPAEFSRVIRKIVGNRGTVEDLFAAQGIHTDSTNSEVKRFQQALQANNQNTEPGTVSYATDCSEVFRLGPCIIWGPGDISQAHQAVEYIEVAQLESACRILESFLTTGEDCL